MGPGAEVRSLEALQEWYAALVGFRAAGHAALTSVAMALQDAAAWLEEQHDRWRREVRRAEQRVSEAKMELRNRKLQGLSGERPDLTVQEKALRRAEADLDFAEGQVAVVRRWTQKLPLAIQDVYQGPARSLEFFLDVPLVQGLAQLDSQIAALEQYLGRVPRPRPEAKETT
jgi:hypothetical protein